MSTIPIVVGPIPVPPVRRVSFEEYYESLETLEEHVLVSVRQSLVEVFPRAAFWGVQTYEGLDAVARLASVGLDLPLRELYEDVAFDGEPGDRALTGRRPRKRA